jgi:hypothetical protein
MMLDYPRTSTIYKITGTKIFRLGSAKILRQFGENVQNKDKSIRHLYLSDGWKKDAQTIEKLLHYLSTNDLSIFTLEELETIKILLQVDESGADALIVAFLCRAGKFRDLFIHGVKPHVYVAINIFGNQLHARSDGLGIDKLIGLSPKELKAHPNFKLADKFVKSTDDWIASERYYYIAKMICHAANYDMRGPTFALNVLQKSEGAIRLSVEQAKGYLEAYHNTFPEIRQWHNEIQTMLNKQNSVLFNLFNEPREFNGIWGDELFREAYAFIPASTVGQIINKAKTKIQSLIESEDLTGVDLLQNGHDSCLAQTLIGQEHYISSVMQEFINVKLRNFKGEEFSMKSEAQRGFNWGPAKKDKEGNIIKNKLGMREI